MAQTGYTPISLYYSATGGSAPTSGNLVAGELAINTADGKLFYKDSAGVVQVLATKDTASGSFTSITDSGNLTFTGTGNRIRGDFSNATFANRVMFQTSTTNGATTLEAIPNGTSTSSNISVSSSSSDPANCSVGGMLMSTSTTEFRIQSNIRGTGTYMPMTFFTTNLERMRIDTSGNVGINTSTPGATLDVNGPVYIQKTTLSSASIEINTLGTGNRYAYIDFVGDDTYTDYGFRIIRSNTGANAPTALVHRGTGDFQLTCTEAAATIFTNSNAESMRITAGGNVGIGTNNPFARLNVYGSSATTTAVLVSNATSNIGVFGTEATWLGSGSSNNLAIATFSSLSMLFGTNGVERMRLDSSGRLFVGYGASAVGYPAGTIGAVGYIAKKGTGNGLNTAGNTFNISWADGLTGAHLWVDSTDIGQLSVVSDYRIKRNIETQTASALEKVMALRPVTYQMADYGNLFKADDAVKEGFIAHEVQAVIPSGVDGEKDAENQIQSLRLDAILSVAVKAIQEQQAMIEELKAKVAALEAA